MHREEKLDQRAKRRGIDGRCWEKQGGGNRGTGKIGLLPKVPGTPTWLLKKFPTAISHSSVPNSFPAYSLLPTNLSGSKS